MSKKRTKRVIKIDWTPEVIADVQTRLDNYENCEMIAEVYGVTRQRIQQVVKGHNLTRKKKFILSGRVLQDRKLKGVEQTAKRLTRLNKNAGLSIEKLYTESLLSASQIADNLKMTVQDVFAVLHYRNVKIRDRSTRAVIRNNKDRVELTKEFLEMQFVTLKKSVALIAKNTKWSNAIIRQKLVKFGLHTTKPYKRRTKVIMTVTRRVLTNDERQRLNI